MTALTAEDAELVARLRRGDASAARELYQRHGAALLRFGMAMSNSRQTAEDIVHDTFIEILKHPIRFDPSRGSVVAYLFGIARHRMSRIARISMRDSGKPLELSEHELVDLDDLTDAGDQLDRVRDIERVRTAVFDLPRAHREVVALCDSGRASLRHSGFYPGLPDRHCQIAPEPRLVRCSPRASRRRS